MVNVSKFRVSIIGPILPLNKRNFAEKCIYWRKKVKLNFTKYSSRDDRFHRENR